MAARRRTWTRGAPLVTGAAAAALVAGAAAAHEVGLSRGDYVVEGASVRSELAFARKELIGLVAGLDADHDGALTAAEIDASRGAIEGALIGRVKVSGDGAPCPGAFERADLAEQDGVAVRAVHRCPGRPRKLTVTLTFLDDLAFGHRHLVHAAAGSAGLDQVLSQRSPSFSIDVPADTAPAAPAVTAEGGPPLRRGALHALTHPAGPVFLLGILAASAGRRAAILASAAFVWAVGLGAWLGASDLFMPADRVLAPALALSLVYVGLETMGSPDAGGRWRVALPFGVVHGLGCAAAFRAGGGGGLHAFGAGAILTFGAVAAALAAATEQARRRQVLAGRRLAALGAAIAAAGVISLVTGRA